MKVGKAEIRDEQVSEEVGGEVDGRGAIKGEGRGGHGKA